VIKDFPQQLVGTEFGSKHRQKQCQCRISEETKENMEPED
jgi:hypothetical protein